MSEAKRFKVGDNVKWMSQAQGCATVKYGVVLGVIPAGGDFPPLAEDGRVSHYGGGDPRNHESYLVEVPSKKDGKPHLYWPRVSALESA